VARYGTGYVPDHWTWHEGAVEPGPAVAVDIDGVLSDAASRQHYLEAPRRNWNAFFEACGDDPVIEETWHRVGELGNPELTRRRLHPTAEEHARWQNHIRYMIPLDQLLNYLRSARFGGIDVYFKRLEWVIYGGRRPPGA